MTSLPQSTVVSSFRSGSKFFGTRSCPRLHLHLRSSSSSSSTSSSLIITDSKRRLVSSVQRATYTVAMASSSAAAAPAAPTPSVGRRIAGALLALAGPASAAAAAYGVAQGLVTLPTALLALALLGALGVAVRTLLEPEGAGAGAGAGAAAAAVPSLPAVHALLRARRSIYARDFSGAPLERRQLETMLEAARWAPTHKLTEPWRFVVLGGAAKQEFEALTLRLCRERLPPEKAEAAVAKLERKAAKDWKSVACYIAICMKRHAAQVPEWEEVAATAAAVQNMWLAATAAGVAGYWSSWQEAARTAPEMGEFLGLEAGDQCLGIFVAGAALPERLAAVRPSPRRPVDAIAEFRLE